LFTGQRWESGLDLYDYRARFYDPLLGRFVSPDTIVPEPGNPQDWNRYSYVTNNPLKFVDPDGHCRGLTGAAWSACAEIVVAVAPAVHQANEYREDIFFPDADTTFADRVEAAAVVGGVPVLAAGAPVLAAKAIPYVYSTHAAVTTASAARPVAAGAIGGIAETAFECTVTGGGCNVGDYVLGATTAGFASRTSQAQSTKKDTGVRQSRQITVLGHLRDIEAKFGPRDQVGLGINVLDLPENGSNKYTPQKNFRWFYAAVRRGDIFYFATDPIDARPRSRFEDEVKWYQYFTNLGFDIEVLQ
jgi:RHS repeat-associated protein